MADTSISEGENVTSGEAGVNNAGKQESQSLKKNLVVHADEAAFVKTSSTNDNNNKESTNEVKSEALLTTLSESFKGHLDAALSQIRDQNKSILEVMRFESAKRTALEQRLHSQLLLQNEYMVAMELKLLRLEAKVERRAIRQQQVNNTSSNQPQQHSQQHSQQQQQQRSSSYQYSSSNRLPSTFTTINESALEMTGNNDEPPPAVISSGASLASGVTAGSFLAEDGDDEPHATHHHHHHHHDDRSENRSDTQASDSGNPVTREIDEDDNQNTPEESTPTQGSRPRVTVGENGTLESILLNPMIGESHMQGLSVRATRGPPDTDGNSSLATSVTNSTVITSTTRGDLSTINVRRFLPEEEQSEVDVHTPSRRGRSNTNFTADDTIPSREEPRSRSQSPLTIASETNISMASASTVGTSIRSSVAVAPRSVFGRRTIPHNSNNNSSNSLAGGSGVGLTNESRPLADRVVSFTPDLTSLPAPPYSVEAADSITMPDELDNISEVADAFATSASAWREEYEARLDALHKRWSNE